MTLTIPFEKPDNTRPVVVATAPGLLFGGPYSNLEATRAAPGWPITPALHVFSA